MLIYHLLSSYLMGDDHSSIWSYPLDIWQRSLPNMLFLLLLLCVLISL